MSLRLGQVHGSLVFKQVETPVPAICVWSIRNWPSVRKKGRCVDANYSEVMGVDLDRTVFIQSQNWARNISRHT